MSEEIRNESPLSDEELAEARALGSLEMQMTTFIVDGIPMSLDEMAAYQQEKARLEAQLAEEDAHAFAEHIKEMAQERRRKLEAAIADGDFSNNDLQPGTPEWYEWIKAAEQARNATK